MRNFLLLSTMVVIPITALAASNEVYTDTHTYTPIELSSISPVSSQGIKLASVCFLGTDDCGSVGFGKGDEDMNVDTAKQCKNEGFVSACASGYCLDGSCAYNQAYGKCLAENCPTNSSTTCTGAVSGKNACGMNCKQCCTNSCPSGYSYTDAQTNGTSGYIKDGTDYCDSCSQGKLYKRKINPCDGYTDTCPYGTYDASAYCLSGTTKKYKSSNCKPCSPAGNESGCRYGTYTCSNGCGGTRTCCSSCSAASSETGCKWGTYSCSDGCGGSRTCCSAAPGPDYRNCCDDVGAGCNSYSECRSRTGYDNCSIYYTECRNKGGNPRIQYCGDYKNQTNPIGCPTTNYNCTRNVSWFICEYY